MCVFLLRSEMNEEVAIVEKLTLPPQFNKGLEWLLVLLQMVWGDLAQLALGSILNLKLEQDD